MTYEIISGETRICLIVGTPISQVKTPTVFNGWALENGHDLIMAPLEVSEQGLPLFMGAMRAWANCVGCVVTYPHKRAAYPLLDAATPEASFVEAVNVVRRNPDGQLVGALTDGIGQFEALTAKDVVVKGGDVLLIGAGGAGSAIAYEAARRGVGRLVILDTDRARQTELLRQLDISFPNLIFLDHVPVDFGFDLACNASPVGMNGDARFPFPIEQLGPATVVSDAVPSPVITPWLEAARRRGLKIQTGQEMVSGQLPHVIAHLLDQSFFTDVKDLV